MPSARLCKIDPMADKFGEIKTGTRSTGGCMLLTGA
jgi:hypothetical protein